MKVTDQAADGDPVMLLLGPILPSGMSHLPVIGQMDGSVISFGKEFGLRLPTHAGGWSETDPGEDKPCILVTAEGNYIRGNARPNGGFIPCYVDVATGRTFAHPNGMSYVKPRGGIFAVEWELHTLESKPRRIVSYP